MPRVRLYTRPTINGRRKYVPADPKLKNNQGTFFLRYKVEGKDVWETTHTETYTFALAAAKQKESTLLLHEDAPAPDVPKPKARLTLDEQWDKFLELKELTKKPDGTRLDKRRCRLIGKRRPSFSASPGSSIPTKLTAWTCDAT